MVKLKNVTMKSRQTARWAIQLGSV